MTDIQSSNKIPSYTVIQRMADGKMVKDVLDLSQEEYENLVKQYSNGFHSEQKYISFTEEDAEKLAKDGEKLIGKGSTRTECFDKAVVFFMSLMEQIWQIAQKSKSFRMELFYDAEILKTNYCFFVPTDRSVSDDTCPEFSSNPY
ncbi:MAG: hypothetical protein K2G55_01730 [Lachnospiraceae bacterium]|nr:hypothetical protein [Lachnospiraceae bacterium]MDE7205147.1 hypothetical protein [Lachnospiraceae bacterium]